MEVVYSRCCGLDVHKKMVVACLIILASLGQRKKEMRTFRTTTQELLLLRDWLVVRMWPWKRLGSIGNPSIMCWMGQWNGW